MTTQPSTFAIEPAGERAAWRPPRWLLPAILTIAVAARIGATLILEAHLQPRHYDVFVIAENLFEGRGFVFPFGFFCDPLPTSYKSPLYVWLLTAFMGLLGKGAAMAFAVQAFQALLAALTCLLLARTAGEITGRAAGLAAAFLYSVHPPAVFMATRMHEINLSIPTAVYLFYEFLRCRRLSTPASSVRLGAAMGLCLLAEPSYGLFAASGLAWLVLVGRGPLLGRVRLLLPALLACGLVLAPWTVRNFLVHGRFVFVKSVFGFNLWIGNNPSATGSDRLPGTSSATGAAQVYIPDVMDSELKKKVQAAPTEGEKDYLMLQAAKDFMLSHPRESLRLALRKVALLWWRDPIHPFGSNRSYQFMQQVLFLAGVAGLALLFIENPAAALLLLLLLVTQTLLYAVFFVLPRYRLLQDPFLIICAVVALRAVARRWTVPSRTG